MDALLRAGATNETGAPEAPARSDDALPVEGPRGASARATGAALLAGEAELYDELEDFARDLYEPEIALALLFGWEPGARLATRAECADSIARRMANIVRSDVRSDGRGRQEVGAWLARAVDAARLLPRVCELLQALRAAMPPAVPS